MLAVVTYMAIYIASALSNPLETAEAVLASAEDTVPISGYFARDEQRIYAETSGSVSSLKSEGEKVSQGESLIVSYTDPGGKQARERINELDERIAELEAATAEANVSDINRLDGELEGEIFDLAYAAATGSFGDAAEGADKLSTLILRRDYSSGRYGEEALESVIDSLRNERVVLEASVSGTEVSLYAPRSGYFTSAADGYEDIITMDSVLDMTPADVYALEDAAAAVGDKCCGRLVTSFGWRFVSVMSEEDASQLEENRWVTMRFAGDYVGEVRVRVYQIGEPQDGECAVVFSCATEIAPLIGLRYQTAELVLREHEGVRVPKAAIRVDEDGSVGVYTLIAQQANFVRVDLETAYETENYYIVAYDPASTSSLRPGDEIIVRSKNIYDGKVIQ